MQFNWPEEHEDGWFEEDDTHNHPALIAWELDHRITRGMRSKLIQSVTPPKQEDYSD